MFYVLHGEEEFERSRELARMRATRRDIGALVSFCGLVRDVNQQAAITGLTLEHYPGMTEKQLADIVAQADGLQMTGDPLGTAHHFANVLFNTMRGGTFVHNHLIPAADFGAFQDRIVLRAAPAGPEAAVLQLGMLAVAGSGAFLALGLLDREGGETTLAELAGRDRIGLADPAVSPAGTSTPAPVSRSNTVQPVLAEAVKTVLTEAIAQWELVYKLDPNYRDVQRNLEKARTLLKRLESIKRSSQTPAN